MLATGKISEKITWYIKTTFYSIVENVLGKLEIQTQTDITHYSLAQAQRHCV